MAKHEEVNCKVLLFTASFPPPSGGGSVEYVANIFENLPRGSAIIQTGNANELQAKEFDVSFPQRVVRRKFILQVLVAHQSSKLVRFLGYFQWPLTGFWLILRERPDVIHIGEHNYSFVAALLAKAILKIPYILYTYAEEITYLTTRPLHYHFFLTAVRNASAVITVSEYTRDILIKCGTMPSRIHKVLPSVSEKKKMSPPKEVINSVSFKYGLKNRRVLLTVARLEERKGHSSVIEALPKILSIFPETLYVIAGTGLYEATLRKQVGDANLTKSVVFAGFVPDAEVAALYDLCDLFIMPHRQLAATLDTEGCPTVFLEASAHAKPVIGGNAGGVADAILNERTGYIIDGTDVNQIAEKVLDLLGNNELSKRLGEAGREYTDALTPEKSAATIDMINKSLMQKNNK